MIIAIVLSLFSSFAINLGNLIEKQAVERLPGISARRSSHLFRTLLTSRRWMVGFFVCLAGLVLQVLALAHASIPVVQSIFNVGIVVLVIASRVHLGERLHRREWTGLALVVVSLLSVSVTLGGAADQVGLGGSGVDVLIAAAPTLAVVAVVVGFLRAGKGPAGFLYGIGAGLLYGIAALGVKGTSTLVVRDGLWHSIPAVLSSVYPYVFVVFSVLGLVIYQMGLQRSRISLVGSMSDVVSSTYLVAIGTVVFGEHIPSDPVTLGLRFGGFAGVLLGSVLVAAGGAAATGLGATPLAEVDLGLGPALATEVEVLAGGSAGAIGGDD